MQASFSVFERADLMLWGFISIDSLSFIAVSHPFSIPSLGQLSHGAVLVEQMGTKEIFPVG